MRCPYCGSINDKVIESRTMANGESIRRRRECITCGHRFTSYERIEEKPLMVIKSDGRREPFDSKKISRGIERALEKRPVTSDMIDQLVSEIEDAVYSSSKNGREINSNELGKIVLKRLYEIDKVAYIRFASVYKHFNNLEEFISEVNNIEDRD